MRKRIFIVLVLITMGLLLTVAGATAVSGAAFTTFNPSVDGSGADVCKNSIINCNIYGMKEYVWLNGGPTANGLGPDGEYFFAVLEPGGQPNPNDQGGVADKNLSDDFDLYTNRQFTVTDGEVSAYAGTTHDFDSGTVCHGSKCPPKPDGLPPYIRLFPYSDTTNPGGVYILAICYIGDGSEYPVDPRDCKYDAFKVREGEEPVTYNFWLHGYKIFDRDANGILNDPVDEGLGPWTIKITGTGFLGDVISETATTAGTGYWEYMSDDYVFQGKDKPQTAHLMVCEKLETDWVQSYPTDNGGCYVFDIDPEGVTDVWNLDFGNYRPIDITVCKEVDDYDLSTPTTPYEGYLMLLYQDDGAEPYASGYTGADGCVTFSGLEPGHSYKVVEDDPPAWIPQGDLEHIFGYLLSDDPPVEYTWTFYNEPAQGCTPGFWQGGNGTTTGGSILWDEYGLASFAISDPDWWASTSGSSANPFNHDDDFCSYFDCNAGDGGEVMWYYVNPDLWPNASDDFDKAARSLVAAYLNASYGINYAYTTGELQAMWDAALLSGDYAYVHTTLDLANNHFGNPDGECPISASVP